LSLDTCYCAYFGNNNKTSRVLVMLRLSAKIVA
jgi:hypothetical protein